MPATGGSATTTPANNPPSFTKGADHTSVEDAGAQTVAGWATAMNSNDTGQALDQFVIVSNNNPSLFSAGPAVDVNTGDLTYTAAANQSGFATIEISLLDVGSGANASAVQTFTITVTGVPDPSELVLASGSGFSGPTANTFTFNALLGVALSNATLELLDVDSNIDITAFTPASPSGGITHPGTSTGNTSGTVITFGGTPTTPGANTFDISLFDGTTTTNWVVTFNVTAGVAPVITSTAVQTATVGTPYTYNIVATGTPTPGIAVVGLPLWLTQVGNSITGTPAVGDVGTTGLITVTATNGVSPDAVQTFTIVVSPVGGGGVNGGGGGGGGGGCAAGASASLLPVFGLLGVWLRRRRRNN